jgi:hypothetical protein
MILGYQLTEQQVQHVLAIGKQCRRIYKRQKPPISATAEMGGFMLVGAAAPIPGDHKVFWYAVLRLRLRDYGIA